MGEIREKIKAQHTLEYSIFIGTFCVAIALISIYIKGGIQGRIKQDTDLLGRQFSPSWSDYTEIVVSGSSRQEVLSEKGEQRSTLIEFGPEGSGSFSLEMPEMVSRAGYVDKFSGKGLRDEKLFED